MENNIGEARRAYANTTDRGVFTQEDAARELGVSLSTYRRWEQGVFKGLKGDNLKKMAELYGVSVDYLLKRTNKPRYTYSFIPVSRDGAEDNGWDELANIYNGLSESGRGQLLDYARFLKGKEKR